MGCKQCKVIPAIRVEKKELNNNKSTEEASVTITQVISGDPNNPKVYPVVTFRNPTAISKTLVNKRDLVVDSIIPSDSEEVPQHLERVESDTPIGSTESFNFQDTTTKGIPSKSDEPNPLTNTIVRQSPIVSEEPPIFRDNPLKFGTMDAIVSYISDDDIVAATLVEPAGSHSVSRGLSSSLVDTKYIPRRKNTLARVMSPKPNRFDTKRTATHNDLWNESIGSYSMHGSIISTESVNSDKPVSRRKVVTKNIYVRSKKSNTRQKPNANETSSESDDLDLKHAKCGSTASKDVSAMKDHLQIILRSATTKLSNPDIHQKPSISETSSGSNEL